MDCWCSVYPFLHYVNWLFGELGAHHPRGIGRAFDQAEWMAEGRLVVRGRHVSPLVEVKLTEVDTAILSFRADRDSFRLHFLLKSPALARAPWLCLEGTDTFFAIPAPLLLARALRPGQRMKWRYWGGAAQRSLLETASLRDALAELDMPPVLLSRPGRVRVVIEVLASEDLEVQWVDRTLPSLERVARQWAELVGAGLPPPLQQATARSD